MGGLLLTGAELLDPEAAEPFAASLLIEGERIAAVLREGARLPADVEAVDLAGARLAPGFIDVHYHGGLVFGDAGDLEPALRAACASLPESGTTAFLPTTVAWPAAELAEKVGRLAALLPDCGDGAAPLGLHLEGPWIDPGAAGAQPRGGIRPFDAPEAREVFARAEGTVRMVTFAPEVEGADRLQAMLGELGVVAALGHSLAQADAVDAAAARGASHVTHLYNAMGGLHHRTPGLAAEALADERLTCDLICDGVHVDPRMVAVAHRAKKDQLMWISDRIEPPAEQASFGSGALHDDGTALRLPDGRLAGSSLTLDRAIANGQAFTGMSRLEAVAACTLRPARLLGVERERGTLRPGARADLVVLDPAGRVQQTWIAGRRWMP